MEFIQCALYVLLLGIASHFIGQALPRHWFDPTSFTFRMHDWEKDGSFYRKIRIRQWKDKLPDASKACPDMYRKEITAAPSEAHLQRLIEESCVAEFVHKVLILLSLLVVKIWKGKNGWPCWVLCVLGNLPFVFIQRYNRPRLQALLHRVQEKGKTEAPEGV